MFEPYESLPKKVQAVQFTEDNKDRVFNSLTGQYAAGNENGKPILKVTTIHGEVAVVRLGDWIVKDAEIGAYYPVKDEVFRDGYANDGGKRVSEANPLDRYVKKPVLDVCCGTRMMWFDKKHPAVIYGDIRSETITVKDTSHRPDGTRTLRIEPDTLMDFRDIPYPDESFKLIAFDPPHLERAGPKSWMKAKYGKLSDSWRDDIRQGFSECFRVLEDGGTLVFKWNETQVKVKEVLELTPTRPLFGQVSGRSGMTHWLVFMKGA